MAPSWDSRPGRSTTVCPNPLPPQEVARAFWENPHLLPAAFLDSMIPKGLYVGADVNPVRTQLADYFGVRSGTDY